ncbi:MAG TPA: hypothetical protein VKV04_22530 [Verrucomicrobiae bacterium]|nr:hypothetical protein [Verrucomicrobiae bacterium]
MPAKDNINNFKVWALITVCSKVGGAVVAGLVGGLIGLFGFLGAPLDVNDHLAIIEPRVLVAFQRSPTVMSFASALWNIYFKPRTWEISGKFYRALGVHRTKEIYFYGRYINTLNSAFSGRKYRPFRGPRRLHLWFFFTFIAEGGHAIIGLLLIWYGADRLVRGRVVAGLLIFAVNIIGNVYPVLAQRYNRARLMRVLRLKFNTFPVM